MECCCPICLMLKNFFLKSETRMTASVLKQDLKTHKRLKKKKNAIFFFKYETRMTASQ